MAGPKFSQASRKRQAKLNFTPVLSSSPAASYLSPEVRDRAAAISYEGSPSKKRRLDNDPSRDADPPGDDTAKSGLPTPVKSSQLLNVGGNQAIHLEESSESDLPRTVKRKKGSKATSWQERVSSTNSHRRRDRASYDLADASRIAAPVQAPGRKGRNSKHELVDLSGERTDSSSELESAAEDDLPSPKELLKNRTGSHSKRVSLPDAEAPRTRSSAKNDNKDRERASKKSATHNEAAQQLRDILGSDDSDDGTQLASSPTKRTQPRARASRGGRNKKDGLDDFINDGIEAEETEAEDEDEPVTPRRRKPSKQVVISDDEEAADAIAERDDEDNIPAKARIKSGRGRKQSKQEEDDLEEDLEFLRSSPPSVQKRSTKLSPKKSARQEALDRLRKARGGPKQADLTNGGFASTQRRGRTVVESDSEQDEAEANDHDEVGTEDEDDLDDARTSRNHVAEALEMFQEDDGDEGFVIEDEEDPLGAPGEIPIEFTSLARANSKDLFRFAIDWMVQKRINPAFDVVGDVYDLTFRKLDDEVTGLVGSKYKSSVWRPDFSYALDARPQVEVDTISPDVQLDFNNCEACGRSNHPATYSMRFHGKAYNRTTLDEVEQDSSDEEDDDEEDEEKPDRDAQGRVIPPESKTFAVGQFCMRNAQTGHTLTHWRYHLYDWVVDWLKIEGHLDPQKVIARDSWSTKKRRKDAQHIVQLMEEKGEIKRLHKDFRIQVTDARDAKQGGRYGR